MQVTALENPEVTARLLAQENRRLKAALREQHQAMVRLAKQARLDAPARRIEKYCGRECGLRAHQERKRLSRLKAS